MYAGEHVCACQWRLTSKKKESLCLGPRKRLAAESHLLLMQEPHVKLVGAV